MLPDRKASGIHTIDYDVTVEWRFDGQLLIVTLPNSTRAAIDTYAAVTHEAAQTWPVEQPFLSLHVAMYLGASYTPYLRHRTRDTMQLCETRQLTGRMVILMPRNTFSAIFQVYLQKRNYSMGKILVNVLFTREEALAWLREGLPRTDSP